MGPGGEGASGQPHPCPLAHQTAPLCQVPLETLPDSLGCGPNPSSTLQPHGTPAPGLAFTGCRGRLSASLPALLGAAGEPAQRCQGGVPGEPACTPGRAPPTPQPPSVSSLYQHQLWAWVCVCCLLSQNSYYGWIIIAIVIPHNWTRLCCLQGTHSMPVTSSDFHNHPIKQAQLELLSPSYS